MNSIFSGATPEQVEKELKSLVDFKSKGLDIDQVGQLIQEKLIPHLLSYDHPGFQSMFNSVVDDGAKLGSVTALNFNQGITDWQVSPGGSTLEELCCRALCNMFNLGDHADATFMLSGSYANQQAIYLALHKKAEQEGFDLAAKGIHGFLSTEKPKLLISKTSHYSLLHAVRTLGLGEDAIEYLPVDKNQRIDIHKLRELWDQNRFANNVFCIVAIAGTTSTGTIDPILDLAELVSEKNTWFHIDGAYGLSYALLSSKIRSYAGLDRADSITWDPHKSLSMPIPSSLLFLKNRSDFERMTIFASYINQKGSQKPNPGKKSIPSTRPFSALQLVSSMLFLGMDEVRRRLRHHLETITQFYEILLTEAAIRTFHFPDTGILCFQYLPIEWTGSVEELNDLQQMIFNEVMAEGNRSISITKIEDHKVLRVLCMNSSCDGPVFIANSKSRQVAKASISSNSLELKNDTLSKSRSHSRPAILILSSFYPFRPGTLNC